nr:hypothetical protein CFP56_72636 [Quercus suber]
MTDRHNSTSSTMTNICLVQPSHQITRTSLLPIHTIQTGATVTSSIIGVFTIAASVGSSLYAAVVACTATTGPPNPLLISAYIAVPRPESSPALSTTP